MNRTSLFAIAASVLLCLQAGAQVTMDNLQVQTRFDFEAMGNSGPGANGFAGRYFNVYLNGGVGGNLTYSYRQRFTKTILSSSYWDATDWAWVDWKFNDRWSVNAGKQVVAIGGFEYDRAPINLYQCSEFWNNIACYQFGASVSYRAGKNDRLTFQACQSPNRTVASGMYAYNLIWYGNHGPWSTIWSVNMVEAKPGHLLNYIALGNRFTAGPVALELDWMNRYSSYQSSFFSDFSVMADLSLRALDNLNLFIKYTYDRNLENGLDFCVLPDTSISRTGAGFEYFPARAGRALRLHGQFAWSQGRNGNPYGAIADRKFMFNCGLTFNLDVLKAILKK